MLVRNAKSTSLSFNGGGATGSPWSGKSCSNGFTDHHKLALPISRIETDDENLDGSEDYVSGLLYDMLQKEVIALRKASHEKDQSLKDKDDAIEVC
jgi:hypothetical protein